MHIMCMYESVKLPLFLLFLADSISLLRFDQYSLRFVHPESSFSAVSGNVPCTTVHLIKVVCLTAPSFFLRSTRVRRGPADLRMNVIYEESKKKMTTNYQV